MKKHHIISLIIFAVTFILPFRWAVLDVKTSTPALSSLGILFTGIGFLAGYYFLLKNDEDKEHGHSHN